LRARIVRILVSFGAVFSAYLVYALIAVRLIEPSVIAVPKTTRSPEEYQEARKLTNQAVLKFRQYFPEGSWEIKNPKVLGNERVKLLVSEYINNPKDRTIKLTKCTMLFFEEPAAGKPDAPPLIMQAPEGAVLKFDEEFDLQRGFQIGRLVGGQLDGKVTISRQASRPGAGDDLQIVTRDVQLVEDRVVTPHLVDFRFGASYGSGREMTILLKREDTTGKGSKGPSINGVSSLTLQREVSVHMVTATDDNAKSPTVPPASTPNPFAPTAGGGAQPPVKITCQGPFRFDLDHTVATFNEKVDVFRLNANGPSDEMNCELLAVHFAERDKGPDAPGTKSAARRPGAGPTALEAHWIEALGDPVIIRAPSQGSQIRSQRVEYDLKSGRIVLDGPGTLQGASPGNAAGRYFAQWSHQLRVEPLVGEQLITIIGGAKVSMSDLGSRAADGSPQSGTLWADEIKAWLTSAPTGDPARKGSALPTTGRSPAAAGAGGASMGTEQARIKRVLAQGAVRVESPQLVGATGQLDAIFVTVPVASGDPAATGNPAASQPAAGPNRRATASQQQFRVSGSKMEIHFAVHDSQTAVTELFLDGKAQLAEAKTAKPEDKPLLVTGDRLEVVRADAPDTRIVVIGKPGHVEARGLTLAGPEIQLERGRNLLWIDGPGRMIAPAPAQRDPAGQPIPQSRAAPPENLEIVWTGRMQFDGETAHFERMVVARTTTLMVRTETLDARLQRRIDFSNPPTPGSKAEPAALEQLVCQGGPRGMVELENRSSDETGALSIDRLDAPYLAVNRTTGGIDARGPGNVSSVRRGASAGTLSRPGVGGPPKTEPVAQRKPSEGNPRDPNALNFLAVKFARAITGNMYQRELTFANQVKCIYGPVPNWETTLDVENPDRAGPDSMALTCDSLTVREAPGRQVDERGWLELETQGNTQAEGMGFVARAHRMTYSEQKSLMVMEGDGTSDASVFRQTKIGGPQVTTRAARIMFWPSTSRIEVGDGRFIDLGTMQGSPARRDPQSKTK
jgi:hypothetical protein